GPPERVNLAAVEEEAGVVLELVGANEHPVPVGAEQRLIGQAGATSVGGRTIQAVVTGVDGVQVPRPGWGAGLADRDEEVGAVERGRPVEVAGRVDLQDGLDEALADGVVVALRVGQEVTSDPGGPVDRGGTLVELVKRGGPGQRLSVPAEDGERTVDRLDN